MFRRLIAAVLAASAAQSALGAQTVALPAWVCAHPDAIFVSAFDAGEIAVPHDPSNGSGGALGVTTHVFHIAGLGSGTQVYYLFVPGTYSPSQPAPFLLALHGTAPYSDRGNYANAVLNAWTPIAYAGRFIVATPVADEAVTVNGQAGVTWSVPPDAPSDYDLFAAVLADVESQYNIDRTRISGWGFSSGGSVMHALGLTMDSEAFNNSTMAGYAAAAGALAGDLCASATSAQCDQRLQAAPRKIPVSLVVGTSDPTSTYVNADYNRFTADGWTANSNVFLNTFAGGHTYATSNLQPAWNALCPTAVTP